TRARGPNAVGGATLAVVFNSTRFDNCGDSPALTSFVAITRAREGRSDRDSKWSGHLRELRWAPAAMKLEDGPRAGGARGRGGDRPTGSMLDRRAVAHSGWGSQACSLSVDVVQGRKSVV